MDFLFDKKKITQNFNWLFVDKILKLSLGMLVISIAAKGFGPSEFGSFNLAQSLVMIMIPFMTLNLDNIIINKINQFPKKTSEILGTSFVIKFFMSTLSIILFSITTLTFELIDSNVSVMMFILLCGYFFQSFDVIDFLFQSNLLSKHVVKIKSINFILCSLLKIFAIYKELPLYIFVIIFSVEFLLNAIGLLIMYRKRYSYKINKWSFDYILFVDILKSGIPMFFSAIVIIIYTRIDQIMIGKIIGVSEVAK